MENVQSTKRNAKRSLGFCPEKCDGRRNDAPPHSHAFTLLGARRLTRNYVPDRSFSVSNMSTQTTLNIEIISDTLCPWSVFFFFLNKHIC